MWIHRDLAGFSLFHYAIGALAHCEHPLQARTGLQHNELWAYPSPAQPDRAFPHLSSALKERGLWQDLMAEGYRRHRWEGRCRDRKTIAYHTPLIYEAVRKSLPLARLPLDLGIQDLEAVICLKEVAEQPVIRSAVQQIRSRYRSKLDGLEGIEWMV